ncbi:flagellar assembly peptidoglycan hydrolase FlgJ [Aquabacterium fontiphilum]|jgi:flagellar protein FlgJ|uniref:flagellar assembly peptidoglycan hydrolase FlgJ n=1 Tax=Aquabacterium fontiphilum TaxID=450365 RepID=UPI0013771C3C|nr:flagellar assembly peptidoglycan hydrolase FlgJ [Aquabacterium fontiphilum]NBD21425.1 flagellar assembly peptidoglycan hydrolase FlgJ [Aquabacterium fontiphilum]
MSVSNTPSTVQGLSVDLRSLDRLKGASGQPGSGQVREVAKQLESLFMQELMKSMRATTMATGMLDNGATELGTSMLDTQLSQQMTGLPGGLSDMIVRQLERQMGAALSREGKDGASPAAALPGAPRAQAASAASRRSGQPQSAEAFVRQHEAAARAAEASTGIPAHHILGQAALESGWGRREIRMPDGSSSHNLFGIKATSSWKGKVAEVTTTEYIGGVPRKVTARFRAYDSYEEAFKDHARLLSNSPRYSQTAAKADTAVGFAQGLQRGGYATDPAYADKLTRVINTALRVQRTMA